MKLELKSDILFILESLEENGYAAYVVGGSVRDALLKREHPDYDISTSASVEEMERIFKDYKRIDVGRKYGNLKISIDGKTYVEVTTFRKEGTYFDHRHPSQVEFVTSIEQDIARRDFTINALAYSKEGELIDRFDGVGDIERKIIRTIGDPVDRFVEDPLRMMRAIRFSAQLDFLIEDVTFETIKSCSHMIKKISKERVRDELTKILISNLPSKGMRLLSITGLLQHIIPDLDKSFYLNDAKTNREGFALEHMLCVLASLEPVLELRLSGLLHGITKPFVSEKSIYANHVHLRSNMVLMILKDLRYSKAIIEKVSNIVKFYDMNQWNLSEKDLKKMIALIGEDGINNVIKLREANQKCELRENNFELRVKNIIHNGEPISKRDMKINGYDLIKIGFTGIEIGETLELLYEEILEDSSLNNSEDLYQRASELYRRKK